MTITVNGDPRDVPDGLHVAALLAHLGLPLDRVALERNLDILPRAQWSDTPVQPDDRYEIVHFVGGG
jgi:thiamine biosynthesis protein ThiS